MRDLIARGLDLAAVRGATYADVRIIHRQAQSVGVKNGVVESLSDDETSGFGVRVIVDGAWGFSSSNLLTPAEVDRVTAEAVAIGRASALVRTGKYTVCKREALIGPPEVHTGSYRTPVQIDPFSVSLAEKIGLLLAADAAMRGVRGVKVAEGNLVCLTEHKTFGSSEGSYLEQEIIETGGGIKVTAVAEGEVQTRSYPNSFGRDQACKGWELILAHDFAGNAGRIAEEAVALLTADQCPSGVTTVILDGSQTALQIHESCGHPIELDRVFGTEASFAGTSFLTPDKLGQFRYGSDLVNLVADATIPGGLGTFGWDDEGVPAQRTPIVKNGIFVGYLTSRETAQWLGRGESRRSNGTARASGCNRIPIVRMTNVGLEPGTWKLADMIADTDEGIYMQTNRSWSIDNLRLNFQFGTEIAWEIKNGKLDRLLKNPTYTGSTPQFWRSVDAIGDASELVVWGTPNCGKGEPSQVAHTGHPAAPIRIRNVQVGMMR
jgi:TldD protein